MFENGHIQDDENDLWLEFGVYSGGAINKIASYSNASNKIYGFDSFKGMPEKWEREDTNKFVKGSFDLKGQLPTVKPNVKLIKGWFNDTIPKFIEEVIRKDNLQISYMHLDADIYSSTSTIFELLAKYIKQDAILDFDELLNYDGYEKHEAKAFFEFVQKNDVKFEWIGMKNKIGARGKEAEGTAVKIISTKFTRNYTF